MTDITLLQQSKTPPFVFCGRPSLPTEIQLIRDVVSDCHALSLTEISRTICELLDWKRPNGRLKNHECRLLLEKLGELTGTAREWPTRAARPDAHRER
jgi:hypothetical protein